MASTVKIKVGAPNLPIPVYAHVTLDTRTNPGRIRIVATAMQTTQEITLSPEDVRHLADELWTAYEAAELETRSSQG